MSSLRKTEWPAYAALAFIVAAGLVLRLHNIDHGLPEVYHPDEALHFTNRAIEMLAEDTLNPGYFQNPSAFTYLVYSLLRVTHGDGFLFRDVSGLLAGYEADPTDVYLIGRLLATALCMLAVVGVFLVARRLFGSLAAVAAAALLSLAFLPVAYSRFAVTDTGVLLPVLLAVYGATRVREDGRLRYYLLTGAAVGLAVGFKYTAGLVGVPLLIAALVRARNERIALGHFALSAVVGVAVFALTTPYFFLDLSTAVDQLAYQSDAAAEAKLGQGDVDPAPFYLGTLTWGFGLLATLAAAAGAVIALRQDRLQGLLLVIFPLLLFVYLCTAGRYFARWLVPVYPILAVLAGLALATLAARLSHLPEKRALIFAGLLAIVLAQPVLADLRTVRMLGRTDTRELARDYLLRTLPPKARVVVEPAVPQRYFDGRLTLGFRSAPKTLVEGGSPRRFILVLEPSSIDRYRALGYCTVMTLSAITERARRDRIAPAMGYYDRLKRESDLVFHADPYRDGADAPEFSFDLSTHLYYHGVYERPGPVIDIYRLHDCEQGVGGKPLRAPVPPAVVEAERRRMAAG